MRSIVAARVAATAVLLVILGTALMPAIASAHERRVIDKYSFLVGFNDEPALQNEPNGAQLTVTVPSENNRPVEGLADALKANVAFGGGQPKEFKLRSVFGQPGRYVADFIPTRPGTYIFTFTGAIEGRPVNERFESGPGRFNDVEAIDAMQFPETVPPGNEVARAARSADDRAALAESAAERAQSLATVGIVVGALGIVIAVASTAMLLSRRTSREASRAR
jgi:hypothetical protein